jgi:hypothetical protein
MTFEKATLNLRSFRSVSCGTQEAPRETDERIESRCGVWGIESRTQNRRVLESGLSNHSEAAGRARFGYSV